MRRALLLIAGLVVLALGAAQLALPGLAERRVRSDLEPNGSRVRVDVEAFPAIKLLWQRADRVLVEVSDYTSGEEGEGRSLADLLARTKATDELDVHVDVLADRLLRMQDVRLRKDGDVLIAEVALRTADLDAALPARLRVTGSDAEGITVAGVTSVFGAQLRAQARVLADDEGRIVLRPEGIPLASLATVPVFSDARIAAEAISARPTPDGFAVSARGRLR
ncbi:MAG: hypothetical protein Q8K79_16980 [Solirubrobacteraceae bacterium]|nr:hypothetical protein [Solirubrobacteraceae bacterium]